jgi:hypothetical protein
MTQGRTLIAALKRKPHTYLEMNLLGVSVAPHMRIVESLRLDEKLVKGKRHIGGKRYLVTWAVKKAA